MESLFERYFGITFSDIYWTKFINMLFISIRVGHNDISVRSKQHPSVKLVATLFSFLDLLVFSIWHLAFKMNCVVSSTREFYILLNETILSLSLDICLWRGKHSTYLRNLCPEMYKRIGLILQITSSFRNKNSLSLSPLSTGINVYFLWK